MTTNPSPRRTIAVFGGSFDPPHVGHVLVPTWLRAMREVDEVWVVPSAAHAFAKDSSPYETRLAWTRAAFRGAGADVHVSAIEGELRALRPDGPVYALDLLEAISARRPNDDVRLVVGSDIVTSGETARWFRWEEIERRFSPIVVPRAGHDGLAALEPSVLPEVSSTVIRAAIASWRSATDSNTKDVEARRSEATIRASVPRVVARMLLEPPLARVAVIGLGHAGRPLAAWLRTHHVDVVEIGARAVMASGDASWERIVADEARPLDGVWLTVHDAVLPTTAAALAERLPPGLPVLHASGARLARSEGALGVLAGRGHPVGTLHPICALRRELVDEALLHLDHATFGVEGDVEAVSLARRLLGLHGGPVLNLQGLDAKARVTYHAACALAANHLAVPRQEAIAAWSSLGIEIGIAESAFDVLMASSLTALQALGVPAGVSGPAARGDRAALAAHAAALPDGQRPIYEVLSARLLELLARPR